MKNQPDYLTTKEKIMQVTMDIIAKEGFQNITIRKVAAQAGVNVAAINYHFGCKDTLITEALRHVTEQLENAFIFLKENRMDPETKLATFIENYTRIIFQYPDIIQNTISHFIYNKPHNRHAEYISFIENQGFELVKEVIAEIRPDKDDSFLSLRTLSLISSLSFPLLIEDEIKRGMGLDLQDEKLRQAYINMLLENVSWG